MLEFGAFVVLCIYTGATLVQTCETQSLVKVSQQTYARTVRAYIGVDRIEVTHYWVDQDGKDIAEKTRTPKTTKMVIEAHIKNFGNVPGEQFSASWKIFANGVQLPNPYIPYPVYALFPGQDVVLIARVGEPAYSAIMGGEQTVDLDISIRYEGQAETCEREQYGSAANSFAALGDSCGVPWKYPITASP